MNELSTRSCGQGDHVLKMSYFAPDLISTVMLSAKLAKIVVYYAYLKCKPKIMAMQHGHYQKRLSWDFYLSRYI